MPLSVRVPVPTLVRPVALPGLPSWMVPLKVVGTAEDEAGALSWLADPEHDCDIAIVDIYLRRGTGLNVLRALQRFGRSADRVVLTNYATDEIRRHALALGASRVFDKSGEIDALVEHCIALSDEVGSAGREQQPGAA